MINSSLWISNLTLSDVPVGADQLRIQIYIQIQTIVFLALIDKKLKICNYASNSQIKVFQDLSTLNM